MIIMLGILYVLACVVTGFMGRSTVFGFLGHFILSLLLTPIIDYVIQVICRPNRSLRRRMEEAD